MQILKLCRFGKACKGNLNKIQGNGNSEAHMEPSQT